jgi:type II secretory pathway component PulF
MDFAYTAIDADGATVSQSLAATTEEQAIRRLQGQGMTILRLEAARAGTAPDSAPRERKLQLFGRRSARLDEVAALTRELAIMIETGVPVVEALETLEDHCQRPLIREALADTRIQLGEGRTMAQALGSHPHVFPRLFIDMVRTAETGGNLDNTLQQAADYIESALEMRRKISGALAYPAVLLTVAAAVVLFLMTYLVPQFSKLFASMAIELPPTTKLILSTSAVLRSNWLAIPLTLGGAFVCGKLYLRTAAGRLIFTRIVRAAPVVGDIVVKVAVLRVLRAMGTLLGSGVSMLVTLDTVSQSCPDVLIERALMRIRASVEQGASLSEAVTATGAFPGMVCQMVAVGEKSGRLGQVMLRVAAFYERDVDARLKMLTSVLEPVMVAILGVVVGIIAISIITPIYSMMGAQR